MRKAMKKFDVRHKSEQNMKWEVYWVIDESSLDSFWRGEATKMLVGNYMSWKVIKLC